MKKVFSLLAVLALLCMAGTAFAVDPFTSTTKAAYASFAAQPLSFDVSLFHFNGNYSSGTSADAINFDASDVTLGVTENSVAISSDYAKITSNLKIQKAGTSIYMYTQSTTTAMGDFQARFGLEAGNNTTYDTLVRKSQKTATAYVDGDFAPMQFKCVLASSTTISGNTSPKSMTFDDDNQWGGDRWLADSANSYNGTTLLNLTGDDLISRVLIGKSGANGGIWYSGGWPAENPDVYSSSFSGDEDVYMFFRAVFHNVSAGDEFGTTTITFVVHAE